MNKEITLQIMIVGKLRERIAHGWRFFHCPNEEVQGDPRRLSKQFALGMLPGVPDLIFFSPEGKAHFMEVKTEEGSLSEAQEDFQMWAIRAPVPHSVVRSIGDAMKVFSFWGCLADLKIAAE